MTKERKIITAAQKLTSASSRLVELLDPEHQDFSTAGILKVTLNEVAQALNALGLNFADHRSLLVYACGEDLKEIANKLNATKTAPEKGQGGRDEK